MHTSVQHRGADGAGRLTAAANHHGRRASDTSSTLRLVYLPRGRGHAGSSRSWFHAWGRHHWRVVRKLLVHPLLKLGKIHVGLMQPDLLHLQLEVVHLHLLHGPRRHELWRVHGGRRLHSGDEDVARGHVPRGRLGRGRGT